MDCERVFSEIEKNRNNMTRTLMELITVPAIAPENGGQGELDKTEKLQQTLETLGFDRVQRFDDEDRRVPSGKRPNIIAYKNGESEGQRLWIVTHVDVVPSGDEALWTVTKPFEPLMKEERVYGRGSEDNGQSMVASIFAVKAMKSLGIKPRRTVALAFVADEEQGSKHGIQYLIKQGLFKNDDLVVVPDSGSPDGSFIEIAEKSSLWFKIRTVGKQTHASRPDEGLNAHRIGMQFALALDRLLHEKYSDRDAYFDPPQSTVEPTKKEKNVDAVNIVPGEDTVYFDCRLLPKYNVDEVVEDIGRLAEEFEAKTKAKIVYEEVNRNVAAKPTDANAPIVTMLTDAIRKVRGTEPKVGGIGGGTCAAFFRRVGIPAVVWSTIDEIAHQPNEYSKTENLVNDAKIFAYLMLS